MFATQNKTRASTPIVGEIARGQKWRQAQQFYSHKSRSDIILVGDFVNCNNKKHIGNSAFNYHLFNWIFQKDRTPFTDTPQINLGLMQWPKPPVPYDGGYWSHSRTEVSHRPCSDKQAVVVGKKRFAAKHLKSSLTSLRL